MPERDQLEVDVLIVGGGPAGLAAAIRLRQLAKEAGKDDLSVMLIEKGGKFVYCETIADAVAELKALAEEMKWAHVFCWENEIKDAFVVYQNFISTFEQTPTIRQIIPIKQEAMREIVADTAKREMLAHQGRRFVSEHFSPEVISARINHRLKEIFVSKAPMR